jgi:hypothetical protein
MRSSKRIPIRHLMRQPLLATPIPRRIRISALVDLRLLLRLHRWHRHIHTIAAHTLLHGVHVHGHHGVLLPHLHHTLLPVVLLLALALLEPLPTLALALLDFVDFASTEGAMVSVCCP